MEIDSKGFVKATGDLNVFNKAQKDVENQSNKTEKSVGSLDDVFRAISPSTLSAVAGITALIGSVKALTGTVKNMLGTYSHFESMQMGLETFFQDADKGKQKFEELRKLSNETTFGVDELTNSFTQLANVGVNVDTINDKLVMLGNIANGDKNKFADLVSVYSKIMSTGKAGSMQLQQLAMRGVPIYDMLKKIGVQGTATGEDITKAFQEMTKEGGQFYNAMNNINKTIEGKEGFISDYFKEMSVNLMEVTGLADAYKKVLDLLKDAIGKVSDKLLEWNKNPTMQALIRGVIAGSITAIGLAITTSVIPALIKTIAQLKIISALKATINPTGLLVGLGISAVAGLAVAVSTIASKEKEINEELVTQIQHRQKLGEIPLDATVEEKTAFLKDLEEQLKQYQELQKTAVAKYTTGVYEGFFDEVEQYKNLIKVEEDKLQKLIDKGVTKGTVYQALTASGKVETVDKRTPLQKQYDEIEKNIQRLKTKYNDLMQSYDQNVYYRDLQKNIESLGVMIEYQTTLENNTKKLEQYSPYTKYNESLKELKTQLETINGMFNQQAKKFLGVDEETGENKYAVDLLINLDPAYKSKLLEAKKYINEQIGQVEIQLGLAKAEDYQKALQKTLGFDDKTAYGLLAKNGGEWIKEYVKRYEADVERKASTDKALGLNQAETEIARVMSEAKDIMQKYSTLMAGEGDFGMQKNGELDTTTKAVLEVMNTLRSRFQVLGGDITEWDVMINNANKATEDFVDTIDRSIPQFGKTLSERIEEALKWAFASNEYLEIVTNQTKSTMLGAVQGTDVGDFIGNIYNGADALGALIGVLVKDLMDVVGGFEKFQYLLDLIKNVLQAISPLLEFILNIVSGLAVILKPLLDMLHNFLEKVFGPLNKEMDDWYNKYDEQAKKQADLTEGYKTLLKAIKEQEEYYIKKKAELNMLALDDKVTKVNDMILSPHGAFSTNPNDTIIATKNPQGLGGVTNNIKVINNAGVNVDVRENKGNGLNEIIVNISRKIASDVAEGLNGWDGAMALQQQRISGRRI